MNLERINRGTAAAIGFLLVGGLFAALTVRVKLSFVPPPVNAHRSAERAKALAEIMAAEEKALNSSETIDADRGIVRLPIEIAMQLAAQKWQNPAAARADLNTRAEKAAAELPKAPEKPSAFE